MPRMFMLALALLCSALWLQAQDTSTQTSAPGSSQTGDASSQTSIEGCLQRADGYFTLTDSAGTAYELRGDTSMLSKHVGHLVKVTGSTADSGAASSTGSTSPGSSQQQTFTVDKVKHISDTCKNTNK